MADPVDNAVSTIRDNLDQNFWDWDVTHGELLDNNRALADLEPAERNAAIGQLSDGELENWAGEVHGTIGSLSTSERQDMFNTLAQGLDGAQLARVTQAFSKHETSIAELGQAIGAHASASVRADYVEAMASATNTGDDSRIETNWGVATTHTGDPEARAVAEVLSTLTDDPASFDRAIGALSGDQLESVFEAAAGGSMTSTQGSVSVNYEPQLLADLTAAAASSTSAEVKARVFDAAANQLEDIAGAGGFLTPYIGQDTDVRQVTDAMSQLIDTDPNGITTELRTDVDPAGTAMVAYTGGLLASGQENAVRDLVVRLQQGNEGNGNAFENFQDPVVARNLGYFSGATAAAINNVTSDREAQADLLKNIFGAGFGAAGAANPVAGVITSVGNGITAQAIDDIVADVADGDKALKTALYELGIPRGDDGKISDAGSGYDSFNAAYAAVAEANR